MKLGVFSMSLSVKNLQISKEFYQKIGFEVFAGNESHKYLIMKNGDSIIGLFEGMFTGNILTFNPGWDANAKEVANRDDIREIQKHLIANNIELTSRVEENTTGPGSITFVDPDGNVILLDQHL